MADRSISELIAASKVTPSDLFVLEQSGIAKKLTGQILENWLLSLVDGHGGIQSVRKQSTSGLADTYRITFADTTTFDYVVTNGRSVNRVTKTGTSGLVDTYEIKYNDGTSNTFTVTNGAKGDKGDNQYVWIKYASQQPTESSDSFGDVLDKWIGIYSGESDTAPTDWTQYEWFEIKGEKGDIGEPAILVSSRVEYQVSDSGVIIPSGAWSASVPVVAQGRYMWTRTTQVFNTGKPVVSYSVSRMGLDGMGSVVSVAYVSPDSNGNVPLTADHVGALSKTGGSLIGELNMNGQPISGLNNPTQNDQAANMGFVNQQTKKAAPRNLLDNSDFTNPVNQRGESTYTAGAYCIDRWRKRSTGTVTVNIGKGITLTNSGSFGGIIQPIENGIGRLAGKTVTMAAHVLECTGPFQIMLGNTTNNASVGTEYGAKTFTEAGLCVTSVTLPNAFAKDYLNFFIGEGSSGAAAGTTLKIAWCALFEGAYTAETLPEYHPKGYAAEYAECVRYFERIDYGTVYKIVGAGYTTGTSSDVRITLHYAVKRAIPTVTLNFSTSAVIMNQEYLTPTEPSINGATKGNCVIKVTVGAGWAKTTVVMYANGYIDASADL